MDQHHSHYLHHHHHYTHYHHNNHHNSSSSNNNNNNRTRYAPPPPPHNHNHNHNHLPPPPPLPPSVHPPPAPPPQAQPPRYRTIRTSPPPPPPPYTTSNNHPPSHQNQFPQFNSPNYPNRPFQEERPISNNHSQQFSQSPRISSRILPDDPLPRRNLPTFDTETTWNPKPGRRVAPDSRPSRNYTPVDLDSELRHHREGVPLPPPPYPVEKIRYDTDRRSSRLRIEYEGNPREDEDFGLGRGKDANYHHYHRRGVGDLPPRRDLPDGGFGMAPSAMSREVDFNLKPGGYVRGSSEEFDGEVPRVGRRDVHGEGKRWLNEKKGPRELPDSQFELGNREFGSAETGDDFRPGKREYYGWESGRYSGRGNSRELGHEVWRTPPKKQIQKKSALLRIQNAKPSYRNRELEQLRNAGYSAESNSNIFKGKEQCGHVGHGMKQEEREGSPVELDISFESNSLVAKAIVTTLASTVVTDVNMNSVSDADLTHSEKRKKVSVSDSDCSGLEAAKVSTDVVNLNSSSCKVNDSSGSVKDLSLQKNVVNPCSQPCTSVNGNPRGKNEVAGGIAKICSGKSSPRIVKKKKVVKRVVKKVVGNKKSALSNSPSANKVHGRVQPDRVTPSSTSASVPNKVEPCSKQKNISLDKVSMPGNSSYNLSKEGNPLPEGRNGDPSQLSLGSHSRSQQYETDEDSYTGKGARFESGLNISNSQSCASICEAKKIDSDCLDANNSVHDLCSKLDTNMVPESLNGSTSKIIDMGCAIKQSCQNQESQSCENDSNVRCPENRFVIDVDDRLLSSADNIGNSAHTNACNSASSVYGLNCGDLTGSKEKLTVTDSGVMGESCFEPMDPTIITKYAILEENPDAINPVSSSGMSSFSSPEKIRIQADPDCIQNASAVKQGSYGGPVNSGEGTSVQCSDITNDAVKHVSPSNAAISSESCGKEELFSSSDISVGFGEGDTINMKKRKNRTHLKSLCSKMEGISPKPVNPVSHANDLDTVSSMKVKHTCPSEVLNQSIQSLDSNLESCLDGIITLHREKELSEGELCVRGNEIDDANYLSPFSKRIKVTTNNLNFTHCQSELSDEVVVSKSSADFPVCLIDKQAPQKGVALSSMDILCSGQSLPCSEDSRKLSGNIFVGSSCETRYANNETMCFDHLELKNRDFASNLLREDLDIQFSLLDGECKENGSQMVSLCNTQTDIFVSGNTEGGMKDNLIHQQSIVSSPANGDGVTTCNSNGDMEEDIPEAPSDVCSQGVISDVPERGNLNCTAIQDEKNCGNISAVEHGSDLPTCTSTVQHPDKIMKSANATGHGNPVMRNLMQQPSQISSQVSNNGPFPYFPENGIKNKLGGVLPKPQKGHSFNFSKSNTKTSASSSHLSNPRTWRRSGNNSQASVPGNKLSVGALPPKRQNLDRKGNFQNASYVRKGNSLVRKPTTASSAQISSVNRSPLSLDESSESTRFESRIDATDQLTLKTGVAEVHQQSQRKPSLSIGSVSEENMSSPLEEPPSTGCCESATDDKKLVDINDGPNTSKACSNQYETPDNQSSPLSELESQVEANDGNISSFSNKKIVYTKPKTNQLIANSNHRDEKSQTAFSDGYYKRSKNQLVRTMNQTVAVLNTTLDSDGQGSCKVLCNRKFSKRQLHKVSGSSFKSLRASLVWTLCGKNSHKIGHNSWHCQKVLPHLFPWKRATYLRSIVHNSASSSNSGSLSAISLKWSKSIEKNSKQANEEATLAVAAVERKKREQKSAACIGSHAKRERIFRIGSVRYKMDPSRRTLQRISDDESLSSATTDSGMAAKRAYIPRRLVIGNDEYVRIGNGNQLIRDPKKRTRKLANEKVRWSLHTARQRLARKQKYCQFFTRFGKCNKEGGKCPYIHDPSKIAVCTKFLNGLCSTPNCKLTHKVIPERMPDCSYFLQGLCTNRNCPYRHVNVNPKASVCEGFLKGYCADGNECRKKHSYICPTFEAMGTCTKGNECKLHHPKKQKGKKRKRSGDQSYSRGRYFGSVLNDDSEAGMVVIPGQPGQNDALEGELSDYISIRDYYEPTNSAGQSLVQALCDSDSLDSQLEDYEVKPILLMKTDSTLQSSRSGILQS
ncbi:hypothetical protein PIB30_057438 [Stylosanthes scabra]|uniref:C3H1-type domain-containing protein n=1 Tax=Stylosanthes scabra TaxID=79078 RepID=A0ABU6UK43_9FABA|nr:hypothetical protein [Stylosanthes scabra]